MKKVYPVVFTRLEDGYMAYVPDMKINTQGEDLAEAIFMARDAIGLMGLALEDKGEKLPEPSPSASVKHAPREIVSMVDIDFGAYRRAEERRTVRRNVSLPSWLNDAADREGLNVSAVLQNALKQELHITQ